MTIVRLFILLVCWILAVCSVSLALLCFVRVTVALGKRQCTRSSNVPREMDEADLRSTFQCAISFHSHYFQLHAYMAQFRATIQGIIMIMIIIKSFGAKPKKNMSMDEYWHRHTPDNTSTSTEKAREAEYDEDDDDSDRAEEGEEERNSLLRSRNRRYSNPCYISTNDLVGWNKHSFFLRLSVWQKTVCLVDQFAQDRQMFSIKIDFVVCMLLDGG